MTTLPNGHKPPLLALSLGYAVLIAAQHLATPALAGEVPGAVELGYDVPIGLKPVVRQVSKTGEPLTRSADINNELRSIAIQPGGKMFVLGKLSELKGQRYGSFVQLSADGIVDPTFKPANDGAVCAVLPDGKIFVTGRGSIARLNPNGATDYTFNRNTWPKGSVVCMALQPDGKLVLGGEFSMGLNQKNITRLNPNGSPDEGFAASTDAEVRAVAVQPDGKILIAGNFATVNGQNRQCIARLNPDGTLEASTTFSPAGIKEGGVDCLAVQPDGKLLIGGRFNAVDGRPRSNIARLNRDGTLDSVTAFLATVITNRREGLAGTNQRYRDNANVSCIALQTDGKILIAGEFLNVGGTACPRVARLLPNGSVERKERFNPHYGQGNKTAFEEWPSFDQGINPRMVLQADGKIVLGFERLGHLNFDHPVRNRIVRMSNDPALETLSVPNMTTVYWMRDGSAPEVSHVTLDVSVDGGNTWKPLGTGVRARKGWQFSNLKLPAEGTVRARGCVPSSFSYGSSGLVESVVKFNFSSPLRAP